MDDRKTDAPTGERSGLSRRRLLAAGGALAFLSAAGGFLYNHFSSTVPLKVESFTTKGSGEKKNILVLTGGGRPGGNSEVLSDAFAEGAREAGHAVAVFHAGRNPMGSCVHCDHCWHDGKPCMITDDGFSDLRPLLEEAQMLVFCSPLYWYNLSGHLQCAIDRMYPYSRKDRLKDLQVREAMLLMCGESHFPRSFAGAAETYRQILGLRRWKDRGRLFVTGTHAYGDMAANTRALETAREMGRTA